MSKETIYDSQDAATAALPKCPKPKGGQKDHWWYLDSNRIGESPDYGGELFKVVKGRWRSMPPNESSSATAAGRDYRSQQKDRIYLRR